jgi:hypothetical protein
VTSDWKHPVNEQGDFIPLFDGWKFARDSKAHELARRTWETEIPGSYADRYGRYLFDAMMEDKASGVSFDGWTQKPDPEWYMPRWSTDQATSYQLYEEMITGPGTPLSPVFSTLEELARWCIDVVNDDYDLAFLRSNISGERPWDRRG